MPFLTLGPDQEHASPGSRERCEPGPELLEDFAFRYGRSSESYLVTEPGRESFWMPDRSGVIVFLRRGRYLHVGGGLLAPAALSRSLLAAFTRWAAKAGLRPLFYNIAVDEAPLFREAGFQLTKWGEEAVIELAGLTWKGKRYEWVRRQSNYALRHGLEFVECHPDLMSHDAWDRLSHELTEVANGILSERPQVGDIGFLNGRFDPMHLGRRRLFLARHTRLGRVEGFLLCNPMQGGNAWALELYRDRPDAVRGTIPFLMQQAIERFQDEHVERVSLCLVPGVRCDRRLPGDSPLIRHAMVLSQYFSFIFDVAGLYHFKSRFRPRFDDRFICAYPAVTLGAACSFIGLCGALRLNSVKLVRRLWRQFRYAQPLDARFAGELRRSARRQRCKGFFRRSGAAGGGSGPPVSSKIKRASALAAQSCRQWHQKGVSTDVAPIARYGGAHCRWRDFLHHNAAPKPFQRTRHCRRHSCRSRCLDRRRRHAHRPRRG